MVNNSGSLSMADKHWNQRWNKRKAALESVLGPADNRVLHATVPFDLGGLADVLFFRAAPLSYYGASGSATKTGKRIDGLVAATCELLGEPSQMPNLQGTYELAIAHRGENDWGPAAISNLARYTSKAVQQPGQTMDIGSAVPANSTIAGFFFDDFKRMTFDGADAGILLCIGLTADEVMACRKGKRQSVYDGLIEQAIFPYTDLYRPSVLQRSAD
jgi:hypothetical protein